MHGIDPERLIFASRAPTADYIRRQALGDVFLDTPIYNAYTTGCDSLWAGVPVVTLPLERMASRVCASLCTAVGLEREMVVQSYEAYEEWAVVLGTDHTRRKELRQQLKDARSSCPLFDTHMWTRDFERLLTAIWERHAEGEAPQTFALEKLPPPLLAARCSPHHIPYDPRAHNLDVP